MFCNADVITAMILGKPHFVLSGLLFVDIYPFPGNYRVVVRSIAYLRVIFVDCGILSHFRCLTCNCS